MRALLRAALALLCCCMVLFSAGCHSEDEGEDEAVADMVAANKKLTRGPLELQPIQATFDQAHFRTLYDLAWKPADRKVRIRWYLILGLVDPKGQPDPEVAGSAAAYDGACDNNRDGYQEGGSFGSEPQGLPGVGDSRTKYYSGYPEFIWYHPDPQDSIPPGRYHCDHGLQGPHGHQGYVSVEVFDGRMECTEEYQGTKPNAAVSPPKCNGIAY